MRESGISQSYLSEISEEKLSECKSARLHQRSFPVQLAQQARRMSSLALGTQRSIRVAAVNGYDDAVRSLLGDPRVDPAAYGNFAIRAAAANGHTETVKVLLADPRVDPSARQNQALRLASTYGHLDIVKLLLADHRGLSPRGTGQALQCACVRGHDAVAEALLADARVKMEFSTYDALGALRGAVRLGNMLLLERLLLDSRIAACKSEVAWAADMAARAGNLAALDRLLRESAGASEHFHAMTYAVREGQIPFVERLLAEPLPQEVVQRALGEAASAGNVAVVERLLADPRCRGLSLAPSYAASHGHIHVLRRLFADARATREAVSGAFISAAYHGHADAVRLALAHRLIDLNGEFPIYSGGFDYRHGYTGSAGEVALEAACRAGHTDIVELLLSDARLVVEEASGAALTSAVEQRRYAVVKLLLADRRVRAAVPHDERASIRDEARRPTTPTADRAAAAAAAAAEYERCYGGLGGDHDADARHGSDLDDEPAKRERQAKAFFRAAKRGDVDRLRELLADPLLDPQAPDECTEAKYCDRDADFALVEAAEADKGAVVDLLLADPCWEPRLVTRALRAACKLAKPSLVERLLADPRVELSLVPERESADSCFSVAVAHGNAEALALLLAEAGVHNIDKAAAGREVIRGLRGMEPEKAYDPRRPALQHMMRFSTILHACVAATAASSTSFPPFMRNVVDVAAIGQRAWARRRLVVAARVRAMEEK